MTKMTTKQKPESQLMLEYHQLALVPCGALGVSTE